MSCLRGVLLKKVGDRFGEICIGETDLGIKIVYGFPTYSLEAMTTGFGSSCYLFCFCVKITLEANFDTFS